MPRTAAKIVCFHAINCVNRNAASHPQPNP